MKRIFGYVERNIDFVCQTFVKATEQCTTTCQIDSVVNNIGIQFGRCIFQCAQHGSFNLRD